MPGSARTAGATGPAGSRPAGSAELAGATRPVGGRTARAAGPALAEATWPTGPMLAEATWPAGSGWAVAAWPARAPRTAGRGTGGPARIVRSWSLRRRCRISLRHGDSHPHRRRANGAGQRETADHLSQFHGRTCL